MKHMRLTGAHPTYVGKFLTPKEAAEYLRVDVDTMANWRSHRRGPRYRKHGGRVVYPIDELDSWSVSSERDPPECPPSNP